LPAGYFCCIDEAEERLGGKVERMSDRKAADVKLLLLQPAAAAYSEDIADLILTLYTRPATGQEMRVYIVGCLVLTLTASVLPQYTLLADRLSTLPSSTSPSTSPSSLSLAKAGFVHLGPGDGSLVCFHCCVRVSPTASTTEELPPPSSSSSRDTFVDRFDDIELTDRCGLGAAGSDHDDEPLRRHRRASPNCYYARLCALARA
uniref:CRAL-TRIO domain-containing protein n=1 Tax=Macrostomum lignano TaxID=282301 RepID=A0A1I8GR59_9PLAT